MHPRHRFIQSYVPHRCLGVLVEFGLETWPDPVSSEFLELSRNVAVHIAHSNPQSLDALLQQAYFSDPGVSVRKTLADASGRLGNGVSVTRFVRWSNKLQNSAAAPMAANRPAVGTGPVRGSRLSLVAGRSLDEVYPHLWFIQSFANGSLGSLVEFGLETWRVTERPEFIKLSHTLAEYIAAMNPKSLEALLRHAIGKDATSTVDNLLAVSSRFLGERISVARFLQWGCLLDHAPVPPKDPAVAVRLKRA